MTAPALIVSAYYNAWLEVVICYTYVYEGIYMCCTYVFICIRNTQASGGGRGLLHIASEAMCLAHPPPRRRKKEYCVCKAHGADYKASES